MLDLKTEFPLQFFTVLSISFTSKDFEKLALALKNGGCPEFTVLNTYFLLFRIFEQLALALKNRVALEFFTVLNTYFLSFRIFEQLALALKTEFALKFFKTGGRPPPPTPRLVGLCSLVRKVWTLFSFFALTTLEKIWFHYIPKQDELHSEILPMLAGLIRKIKLTSSYPNAPQQTFKIMYHEKFSCSIELSEIANDEVLECVVEKFFPTFLNRKGNLHHE